MSWSKRATVRGLVVLAIAALPAHVHSQPDSGPRGRRLDRAVEALQRGEPTRAETQLRELLASNPDDAPAHAYLALAILCQEEAVTRASDERKRDARIQEAFSHCEQAIALDPQLPSVRLIHAMARARLEKTWSAAERLQHVDDALQRLRGLPSVADEVEQVERLIRIAKRSLQRWSLSLYFGSAYDTNVPLIGRNTGLPRDLGRRRDYRFGSGFEAAFRVCDDFRLKIDLGGSVGATWHSDLDLFDEQTYGAFVHTQYHATDWLDIGLHYDYAFSLLGREDYLSRHRMTPYVRFAPAVWGRTTLYYDFEPRRFFEIPGILSSSAFDRSGDLHAFGATQLFALGEVPHGKLLLDLGYRHEDISTAGTEYDARSDILAAGLGVPVLEDLAFYAGGEWTWEDYKRRSRLDRLGRGRNDFVQTYVLSLSYAVNEDISLHGQVLWTDDDSNVLTRRGEAVFSYDRVIYTVFLTVRLPLTR